jgi:hypothetical protein
VGGDSTDAGLGFAEGGEGEEGRGRGGGHWSYFEPGREGLGGQAVDSLLGSSELPISGPKSQLFWRGLRNS